MIKDKTIWEQFYNCLEYLKEKKIDSNGFRISRITSTGVISIKYKDILIEKKNMKLAFNELKKQLEK